MSSSPEFSPTDFPYTSMPNRLASSGVKPNKQWSYFERIFTYIHNPSFFEDHPANTPVTVESLTPIALAEPYASTQSYEEVLVA